MSNLTDSIDRVFGKNGHFVSYTLTDNKVYIGIPPSLIFGLSYVYAKHNNSQTIPFMSLTGNGIFVSNKNQSGIIELGVINGSPSNAYIQLLEIAGVPFPIKVTDLKSGDTSFVGALSCRRVGTPEWRRANLPSLTIHTFYSPSLLLSDGLRLFE